MFSYKALQGKQLLQSTLTNGDCLVLTNYFSLTFTKALF